MDAATAAAAAAVKYCTRKCCQQRRAIFVPDKQNGNVNSVNGTSNFADYFRHTVRTIDPAFFRKSLLACGYGNGSPWHCPQMKLERQGYTLYHNKNAHLLFFEYFS